MIVIVVNGVVTIEESVSKKPVGILTIDKGKKTEGITFIIILDNVVFSENLHPPSIDVQLDIRIVRLLRAINDCQT